MRIGIAGTGKMGTAIGARLLELKHEVHVWNRSAARTLPLVEQGALAAGSASQLPGRCDAVLTILTDAAAIDAVYNGKDGLLSGSADGKLFIEMSTVSSATERALAPVVAAKGAALVECPVGGSTAPARDGKLFGFVAGNDADVDRARPILEQLCRRVEHVGGIGAGAAMKLAINLPLALYWQVFGEALGLVEALGLPPQRLVDIFSDTSAGPNMLKPLGPNIAQALSGDMAVGVFFDVDSVRKDLRTMLEEGRARGRSMPLVTKTLDLYDEASAAGLGTKNCTTLLPYWLKHGQ